MAGPLVLPEEFALLSLAYAGKVIDSAQARRGCAVAELGELVLRGRLTVRPRKSRVLGLDGYHHLKTEIEVADASPTGLAWADEVLAGLAQSGGTVVARKWVLRRTISFLLHRDALAGRGLIRHVPASGLFRRERSFPDRAAREQVISKIRLRESQADARVLFLADLVIAGDLARDLHIPRPGWRQVRDMHRGAGAAGSVPETLREASYLLSKLVPERSRGEIAAEAG